MSRIAKVSRQAAIQIVKLQLLATVVLSLLFLSLDIESSYSVLLGGLICVVANAYFVFSLFRESTPDVAQVAKNTAYKSVLGKFVVVGSLLMVVFSQRDPLALQILPFFVGFVIAQACHAYALVSFNRLHI